MTSSLRIAQSPIDSIIIDADDTNADTYGAQQLTLFNAYYGEYCYMPLLLFEGAAAKTARHDSNMDEMLYLCMAAADCSRENFRDHKESSGQFHLA